MLEGLISHSIEAVELVRSAVLCEVLSEVARGFRRCGSVIEKRGLVYFKFVLNGLEATLKLLFFLRKLGVKGVLFVYSKHDVSRAVEKKNAVQFVRICPPADVRLNLLHSSPIGFRFWLAGAFLS